jgi:methionyl-tRNA formyltransferase
LFSTEVEILDNDNAGDLHDKLMLAGAELLIRTVNAIKKNDIHPIPQDSIDTESLKHAPKIFKEDCLINWENDSVKIYNLIRGLSPYPTAFTHIDGKVLKIYESEIIIEKHDLKPGTYISNGKNELKFATKDGFLKLLEIQIEGKKRMSVSDFLRGYRLEGTTN